MKNVITALFCVVTLSSSACLNKSPASGSETKTIVNSDALAQCRVAVADAKAKLIATYIITVDRNVSSTVAALKSVGFRPTSYYIRRPLPGGVLGAPSAALVSISDLVIVLSNDKNEVMTLAVPVTNIDELGDSLEKANQAEAPRVQFDVGKLYLQMAAPC